MNNCYGKNGDMQQRLLHIYPAIGDAFELLICVPDTDDEEIIEEFVEKWLEDNTKRTIEKHKIMDSNMPSYELIETKTDCYNNEYEIYSDNPCMLLSDYLKLQQ